jgi:hypothetical protein
MGKSKTGGGVGTNQHQIMGASQARAKAASRRPAVPAPEPTAEDRRKAAESALKALPAYYWRAGFDALEPLESTIEHDPANARRVRAVQGEDRASGSQPDTGDGR